MLAAARRVLQAHGGGPLHLTVIVEEIIGRGLVQTPNNTLLRSLETRLSEHTRVLGEDASFERVGKRTYVLRKRAGRL